MPRIADALDRESQSVDLERGDFERLLERRERKQRNRRIGAGAVAVIVALATAALLTRYIAWEHVPATPQKPLEVLLGAKGLGAREPDSGQTRSIVDAELLPPAPGESITGAAWSSDRQWVAFRRGSDPWPENFGSPTPSAARRDRSPWTWAGLRGSGRLSRTNSSSCLAAM
jgi:hypothetical protein